MISALDKPHSPNARGRKMSLITTVFPPQSSGIRARLFLRAWALVWAVMAYSLPFSAAAAAGTSINVNPVTGDDSLCGVSPSGASCRSIARAVQLNIPGTASYLNLSAGIYNETTISISNVSSLVISGVPNATVFDCRGRQGATSGAAFAIINSTVAIVGLTFEACSNPTSNGGAVSASGSSVVLSQCSFTGCSAASGGAVSVTGPGSGSGLFLSVQNSTFTNNSASGSLEHCPANTAQPCSTWGGAVAAFEMYNVSISGCTMVANRAAAVAPPDSTSSLAGGGCLSVLFRGNASGAAVHVSSNRFLQCIVDVGAFGQGNGKCDACTGFGSVHLIELQGTEAPYPSTSVSRPDCSC